MDSRSVSLTRFKRMHYIWKNEEFQFVFNCLRKGSKIMICFIGEKIRAADACIIWIATSVYFYCRHKRPKREKEGGRRTFFKFFCGSIKIAITRSWIRKRRAVLEKGVKLNEHQTYASWRSRSLLLVSSSSSHHDDINIDFLKHIVNAYKFETKIRDLKSCFKMRAY